MDTDVAALRLPSEVVRVPSKLDVPTALVKQIEFYFSDVNLASDKYLLGQVQSSPDGFVPIRLISQFKRVKALTTDPEVIMAALRSSAELELDEVNQQIRRKKPLVQIDTLDIQRRTVIVELLPGTPTIDSVTEQFSPFGHVNLVRICPPGSTDKLPAWLTEAEDINYSDNLFALIEYDAVESAIAAVDKYADDRSLSVRHLVRRFRTGELAPNDDNDDELLARRMRRREGLRSGSKTSRRPRRKSERGSETESPMGSLDTPTHRRAGSFSSGTSYRRSPGTGGANRASWRTDDGEDSPPDSGRSQRSASFAIGSPGGGSRSYSFTNGDTPRRHNSASMPGTPGSRLAPRTPASGSGGPGGSSPPTPHSPLVTPRDTPRSPLHTPRSSMDTPRSALLTPRSPLEAARGPLPNISLPGGGSSATSSPTGAQEGGFAVVSQDLDISMLHSPPLSPHGDAPPAQPASDSAAPAAPVDESLDTLLGTLPALRISSRFRGDSFTPTLATIPSMSLDDQAVLASIAAAQAVEGVPVGGIARALQSQGSKQRRKSWQVGDGTSPLPPLVPGSVPHQQQRAPQGAPPQGQRSRANSSDGHRTPSANGSAAASDEEEEHGQAHRTPSGGSVKRRTRRGGRKRGTSVDDVRAEEARGGSLSEGVLGTTPTGVHTPTELPPRARRASYSEGTTARSSLSAVLAAHHKGAEDSGSHSNDDDGKGGDWGRKGKGGKKDYASWAAATPDFRALSSTATKYTRTASAPGAPPSHSPLAGPRMPDGTKGFTMGRGRPLAPAVS